MTPERWQRVKELFSAASVKAPAELPAYLEAVCGADTQLRDEVQSLLDAHASESAIVDSPAVAYLPSGLAAPQADRRMGQRIGPYELEELIGRGGMGEVYRARRVDAEYDREVAIKLVPGGLYGTYMARQVRAERQILANLDHPNIARLFDGGVTADGSPYLVMELVVGEAIDRYSEARKLSLRERLTLFLDACAAVSYAHRHLVIHRDLKPGNIFVTHEGQVKLLDFGIARLLQPGGNTNEAAAPTVTLLRTLTPGFASPEQLLGRPVTTASDVYSLGVVLYVLLTGRSPYRRLVQTAEDAIQEICETAPLRPSAALAAEEPGREQIDHDLDAILLQALRKEPERRYASVELFAQDLRNYLEGRPVAARGEALSYRAGKFMRRHWLKVGVLAALVFGLLAATANSLREARIADEQRARAERHLASVRSLANTFMFEVNDAIEQLPGATHARELLIGTALKYLDSLSGEVGDDIGLRIELAAAYEKLGDVQGRVHAASKGEPRAALDSYARAIALLAPVVADDPARPDTARTLARIERTQSRILLYQGKTEEAKAASQRSLDLLETLSQISSQDETLNELAQGHVMHGIALNYTGGTTELKRGHLQRAVNILEGLVQRHPEDRALASTLASAYRSQAMIIAAEGPYQQTLDQALLLLQKSRSINQRLVAESGGQNVEYLRNLGADYQNVAANLYETGDFAAVLENLHAARATWAARESDPGDSQARIDGTIIGWHEGRALLGLGRMREAEAVLERNLQAFEEIGLEGDNLQVVFLRGATETYLGVLWERRSDRRAARQHYAEAVQRFARITAIGTLDRQDMLVVNDAREGLARVSDRS